MFGQLFRRKSKLRIALRSALTGQHVLAFLPATALAAFWIGGEPLLLLVALGLPVLYALAGGFHGAPPSPLSGLDTGLADLPRAQMLTDQALAAARAKSQATACILIEVDSLDRLELRQGEQALRAMQDLCLSRLRNLLRTDDLALRIGDARFMVVLAPAERLDLEALLQMTKRLQSSLEEPASIVGTTQYMSVCVGFCSSNRLPVTASGERLLEAASTALTEAVANGPSAIRSWSEKLGAARSARASLRSDASQALENGEIQPWFQPQICTSTGRITGVEALARWIHPERGVIAPIQFLTALEDDRRMERLSQVIVTGALSALCSWDRDNLDIPRVSVNFSMSELRNPKLVDKVAWELDRFNLTPQRLGVEVLETVIADTSDGIVARNIGALSKLGCHIDLDDFGIGHASISALRRFPVNRLKIDRSFVTRVDRDEEQRRMIAAILGMADRLGVQTLAEGVESIGEHALLAQLGCDHVQGYGIARPMPSGNIKDWVIGHREHIAEAAKLGRKTS